MLRSEGIYQVVRAFACTTFLALVASAALRADASPERVVSINLCTDQLALLLAAPEQLISVSRLAHDPESSALSEKARALPSNGSGAEEIYLLQPDLVLAGTYTSPATVTLLRDLGIRVELFAPANALTDVPLRLKQMGAALGRDAEASEIITRFEAQLAALSDAPQSGRLRAAITYVNSYSSGDATLAGDIIRTAGFDNVATELGLSSTGRIGLEELVLAAPDLILRGRDYTGVARAEDNLDHPALKALPDTYVAGSITDADWICGTPQVLHAIEDLRALRLRLEAGR